MHRGAINAFLKSPKRRKTGRLKGAGGQAKYPLWGSRIASPA